MKSNPRIMFVRATENCNAGCFMCDFANNNKGHQLSIEEFKNLIDIMKKGEYKVVKFTGGEPLLNNNLKYFISLCKENGYASSVITNGYILKEKYKELIDAGLNHITISLDSNKAEIHDDIRGLKGLFDKIIESIKLIKAYNPAVVIRINTIGSWLNIFDLCDMYDMLKELKINQWVITPLKSWKNHYENDKFDEYYESYKKFQEKIKSETDIQLLGFSKDCFGRTKEEFIDLVINNKLYKPTGKCYLVDKLRFYVPSKGVLVPCSSASHRIHEIQASVDENLPIDERANCMADWLRDNGPNKCTGCGPINVWLAENPELLEEDVFLY